MSVVTSINMQHGRADKAGSTCIQSDLAMLAAQVLPQAPCHLCFCFVAVADLQKAAQGGVALNLLPDALPLVAVPQPQLADALLLLCGRLAVLQWWQGMNMGQVVQPCIKTLRCCGDGGRRLGRLRMSG